MPSNKNHSTGEKQETILSIKLIPRAPRNEFLQILENGTIKIRITAPPVDGKANLALIDFLSGALNISESNIKIISGQTSHIKLISFGEIKKNDLLEKIHKLCK